jgi:hypothetical protein
MFNGKSVAFDRADSGYFLKLPDDARSGPVTVIRLELD